MAELQEINRLHHLIDTLTRQLQDKRAATETYRRRAGPSTSWCPGVRG